MRTGCVSEKEVPQQGLSRYLNSFEMCDLNFLEGQHKERGFDKLHQTMHGGHQEAAGAPGHTVETQITIRNVKLQSRFL